jgi:hypothetical protein
MLRAIEGWIADHSSLYRRLTDRRVVCRGCGTFVGYVWRHGHAAWLCEDCGGGEVTAV